MKLHQDIVRFIFFLQFQMILKMPAVFRDTDLTCETLLTKIFDTNQTKPKKQT